VALYAISFRVEYEGDYDGRYASLVEAIRAQASGTDWWEETTSFMLITSDKSPAKLADDILSASTFDATKDLLLVIYLSGNQGYAIRGKYADKDVLTLLRERR
jgi:hypothetical protein